MALADAVVYTFTYSASALLICAVLLLGYRITLHPLSGYPGPFTAKLSDFYSLYYALSMNEHVATYRDHQLYGPVVRHGPNKLVFNSLRAFQDIYNSDRVTKSSNYLNTMQAPNVYSFLNIIDKRQHRQKRRLIGQAINDRAMRLFEPTMLQQTDIFIQQLSEASRGPNPEPINMTPRLKWLTLDVVCLLAFGFPLHAQTSPQYRFVPGGMAAGNYFLNLKLQCPLLSQLRLAEALQRIPNLRQRRVRYRAFLQGLIAGRLAEPKHAHHDLYSMVAGELDSEGKDGIRTSDLWAEALFFLSAGGDTAAAGLAALFFYLSRNRKCYSALAHEIRSTFDSSESIRSGQLLSSCHYLRACIDEALRMSPPAPGTPWREQVHTDQAKEPLVVDGHAIPRGTHIGVSVYSILHNERYFPDPFRYRPGRWLSEDSDEDKLRRSAFAAFLAGSRGCAGKSMAYLEMSLVMAKTLWHFDFEKPAGLSGEFGAARVGGPGGRQLFEEFQLFEALSSTHDGPNLVFRPRAGL